MLALAAYIQTPPAAIRGALADATGASVANATIKLLAADSNVVVARASSDRWGAFDLGALKPGSYTLTAYASGFRLRVWKEVAVRESETRDLGQLQLSIGGCDAPGVICDTFTSAPVFPGLILQGELSVGPNCGADLIRGHSSCPADENAEFEVAKEGAAIYLLPRAETRLFVPDSLFSGCKDATGNSAKIRIDGFGPGLDFCVVISDRRVSHAYLSSEVDAETTVHIWFTTTKEK